MYVLSTIKFVSHYFLIAVPQKPVDVSIESFEGDQVVLQWVYDNTTKAEPPLYYRVIYRPKGGITSTVDIGYQEGQLVYSITLSDLKPSTSYEISVSSMTSYLTSESINVIIQTPEGEENMFCLY